MDTAPVDSLVALAGRKQLPRHQFMDTATVEWIAANRPALPIDGEVVLRLPGYARRLLALTAIPDTWFAEPRLIDSIHGLRHGMRTAAYIALLAENDGLGDQLSSALIIAAALHDCRRLHDQDDTGHGARAAAWLETHAGPVADHFGVWGDVGREFWQAATAVRLHDIPYEGFGSAGEAEWHKARRATDLLKAADTLDRYRLPKLKWWPDARHLRVPLPARYQRFAYELVLETERAHLDGTPSAAAIMQALSARGLM
jgi:hypothetical protein